MRESESFWCHACQHCCQAQHSVTPRLLSDDATSAVLVPGLLQRGLAAFSPSIASISVLEAESWPPLEVFTKNIPFQVPTGSQDLSQRRGRLQMSLFIRCIGPWMTADRPTWRHGSSARVEMRGGSMHLTFAGLQAVLVSREVICGRGVSCMWLQGPESGSHWAAPKMAPVPAFPFPIQEQANERTTPLWRAGLLACSLAGWPPEQHQLEGTFGKLSSASLDCN